MYYEFATAIFIAGVAGFLIGFTVSSWLANR